MTTQKPLVSLSQETLSQGRHGNKLMEEIMNRSQTPPPIPLVMSLSREIISKEILKKPKQGKLGTELIEEMKKPPIPIPPLPLVTKKPKLESPPIYLQNLEREYDCGLGT